MAAAHQRDNSATTTTVPKIEASMSYETTDGTQCGNDNDSPKQSRRTKSTSSSRSPVKKAKKGVTKLVNKVLQKLAKDTSVKRLEDGDARPLLKETSKSKTSSSLKKMFKTQSSGSKTAELSKQKGQNNSASALTVISLVTEDEESKLSSGRALLPEAKKNEKEIEIEKHGDTKSELLLSSSSEDEKESSNDTTGREVVVSQDKVTLKDHQYRERENEGISASAVTVMVSNTAIALVSENESGSIDSPQRLVVRTDSVEELSVSSDDFEAEEEEATAVFIEESGDEDDNEGE
jgi:hypothetical protein